MKKFITACLIVVAFIAFTTKPTMAEPITLTVMAITGLIVVASSATLDTAYHAVKDSHIEDGSATILKNDGRAQAQNDSDLAKVDQIKSN
jgi:heme/copper-type cytochrome/quinol oxidase subunit 3